MQRLVTCEKPREISEIWNIENIQVGRIINLIGEVTFLMRVKNNFLLTADR